MQKELNTALEKLFSLRAKLTDKRMIAVLDKAVQAITHAQDKAIEAAKLIK